MLIGLGFRDLNDHGMLAMMPHIIFDRSIIDTSQRSDMSRRGLVNLKANSTLF